MPGPASRVRGTAMCITVRRPGARLVPKTLRDFVLRLMVLSGLGLSCALTVAEDRKERALTETPPPAPPPPANLVFADAIVADRETSLEWTREVALDRLAWADAKSYCAALGLEGGGWRLPSQRELLSILRYWHDPLDGGLEWFWSADVGVREGTAWAVGSYAWLNGNPVETKSRVRCVRDARSTP